MDNKCDTLIVGAGLAGLSAAWHLTKENKGFRIIESTEVVGGLTKTEKYHGFQFDHTGHLLHIRDTSIKKWIIDELFKGQIPIVERVSRVWSSGVYTKYPFQANTYGLPEKVSKECIDEYLKVADNPPKNKLKTAEDFIYAYFGRGFAKHFMIPYNKKIWGVHPKQMSAAWGERFVPIPKKDAVLAGMKPGVDLKLGYNSSFYYPKEGMGELSQKIYSALQKSHRVEFGISIKALYMKKKIAVLSSGEHVHYNNLISTIPLKTLLSLTKDLDKSIQKKSQLLKCKSMVYLNVGLNIKTPQKFHWCYVPSLKVPFYRVGIYSNLSSELAPKGKSSLYIELSSRHYDKKVLPKVISELKRMRLIRSKKDISFMTKNEIKFAYVIYDQNYFTVVPKIHETLHKFNIYSIGRWGAWNYSSMEDALIMGRETVKQLR